MSQVGGKRQKNAEQIFGKDFWQIWLSWQPGPVETWQKAKKFRGSAKKLRKIVAEQSRYRIARKIGSVDSYA
jgi:hypothetical protein